MQKNLDWTQIVFTFSFFTKFQLHVCNPNMHRGDGGHHSCDKDCNDVRALRKGKQKSVKVGNCDSSQKLSKCVIF